MVEIEFYFDGILTKTIYAQYNSLKDMVDAVIPMCNHYKKLKSFKSDSHYEAHYMNDKGKRISISFMEIKK